MAILPAGYAPAGAIRDSRQPCILAFCPLECKRTTRIISNANGLTRGVVRNQNHDAIRTCNLGEAVCLSDFLVGADHISRALGNSFSVCHLKLLMNTRLTQLQDKTLALPVPLKSDRAIDVCQRRGISL